MKATFDIKIQPNGKTQFPYVSRGSINSDSKCSGGIQFVHQGITYSPTQNSIATKIEIGIISYESDKFQLHTGAKCQYSSQECFTDNEGFSFRELQAPECRSDSTPRSVVFEGLGKVKTNYGQTKIYSSFLRRPRLPNHDKATNQPNIL
jgi:hypothetical protein